MDHENASLYWILSTPVLRQPEDDDDDSPPPPDTAITATKETVDNDVESLNVDTLGLL